MAKDKALATHSFWAQLFRLSAYKKRQGRTARQVTFAAIVLVVLVGAYRLNVWLTAVGRDVVGDAVRTPLVWAVAAVGVFLAYRVVNYSRFADFLILVEAEMTKVSWPSRQELIRSSIVVIATMLALAALLFAYDLLLAQLFRWLHVRL